LRGIKEKGEGEEENTKYRGKQASGQVRQGKRDNVCGQRTIIAGHEGGGRPPR